MEQTGRSDKFEFKQRISVVKNEDYHFEVDEFRRGDDQLLLVHCRVFRWKPSVLKRMLLDWRFIRANVITQTVYCTGMNDDDKFRRWCRLFDFKLYLDAVPTDCGEPRSLYVNYGQLISNNQFFGHDQLGTLDAPAELPT